MQLLKSLIVWVLILPLAILNGGFREKILTPYLGESVSYPLSGIILCILIFLVSVMLLPKFVRTNDAKTYWKMGLLWIVMTIGIEFVIGAIMGESMQTMLSAYDITTGNLWLVVVLFTGIAPWLSAKIKEKI